jgi:hypothetical protein
MIDQIEPSLDIFKLWQPVLSPTDPGVAFTTASGPEVSLWRLDLSANSQQAQQRLAQLEAEAHQAEVQLDRVRHRLDQFMDQTTIASTGRVSFSRPAATGLQADRPLPQAETDLQHIVTQIRGPVSYATLQPTGFDLQAIGTQFQQACNRVFQLSTHLAWVETRVEAQLLAQTTVSWTGETRTAWEANLYPAQQVLHQRNLTVALAGRLVLLRTLVITLQGAAKIAVLLGTTSGIGSVLTLPIAWKYVSQILAEIEKYKTVVEEAEQQIGAIGPYT